MSDRMWGGDEKSSPSFFPRDDQYFSLFIISISFVSLVVRPGYFLSFKYAPLIFILNNKKKIWKKNN